MLLPRLPASAIDEPRSFWQPKVSLAAVLAASWLGGSLGLAMLLLGKWLVFRHVLKRSTVATDAGIEAMTAQLAGRLGLRRSVPVLVTAEPIGPAVFGLFRPAIVLPQAVVAGKTLQQIEPILAHELVHVRRGDAYWGCFSWRRKSSGGSIRWCGGRIARRAASGSAAATRKLWPD